MHPFNVVIPARYASTRLPGKPLRMIGDKTMLQHVYERAQESGAQEIVIATDDERIHAAATGFGADVCMTASDHTSGTDRIAEVARIKAWPLATIIVNLQGDEPLLPGELVRSVAQDLASAADAGIATLATPIHDIDEVLDPNAVKVVSDEAGYALYFSRAPIPWDRDWSAQQDRKLPDSATWYRHIGLYAYRAGLLADFVTWPPASLEQTESLEQLRALQHGIRIRVTHVMQPPPAGVDTEADLQRTVAILQARAG